MPFSVCLSKIPTQSMQMISNLCAHSAHPFIFRLVSFYGVCLPCPISQPTCLSQFSLFSVSGFTLGKKQSLKPHFFPMWVGFNWQVSKTVVLYTFSLVISSRNTQLILRSEKHNFSACAEERVLNVKILFMIEYTWLAYTDVRRKVTFLNMFTYILI